MCWVLFHFFLPFGFFSLSSFQLFPTPLSLSFFFLLPSFSLSFYLLPPAGRCYASSSHHYLITVFSSHLYLSCHLPVDWFYCTYIVPLLSVMLSFLIFFSSFLFLFLYLLPLFPYYSLPRITMFILHPPFSFLSLFILFYIFILG